MVRLGWEKGCHRGPYFEQHCAVVPGRGRHEACTIQSLPSARFLLPRQAFIPGLCWENILLLPHARDNVCSPSAAGVTHLL